MEESISLKESVYAAVLEGIFNNEYRANQIITEKELIQRYGSSKSPVREALVALCNDDVLRSIPRCGYQVVRLIQDDVENMLRARYLLEGGMLKICYQKFLPNHLEKLEEIDNDCARYQTEVWKHWDSNTKFHMYMISLAKNDCTQEMLYQIMGRLKRAYAQLFWDRFDELNLSKDTARHRALIDALQKQDLEQILSCLKEDLQQFGDYNCLIPDYFS